ncbi:N-acetylmuramoyl-L-alanine amidase LytC precursor [Clostridiales bacterium CHKCI006]|nr:N-acetylmuramoyl-L-alanine amidase LytC precursor [Clostridiales bacterium CHKCI006]
MRLVWKYTKRYGWWLCFLGFILLFLWILQLRPAIEEVTTIDHRLAGRKITIDVGHGGLDNGATYGNIREDELNLKIAQALKAELEKRGAIVTLTRDGDYDMTMRDHHYSKQDDMYLRAQKIDAEESVLFVSIHLNASSSSSAWGSQVFYYTNSEQGQLLAKSIHQEMQKVTGTRKSIQSANFYVLRATATTGVLIECGFISHPSERGQLSNSSYHEKLAIAISDGIGNYLESNVPLE